MLDQGWGVWGVVGRRRAITLMSAYLNTSFAGPAAWNALSLETRSATSLEQFKSKLKTELFTKSYS